MKDDICIHEDVEVLYMLTTYYYYVLSSFNHVQKLSGGGKDGRKDSRPDMALKSKPWCIIYKLAAGTKYVFYLILPNQ